VIPGGAMNPVVWLLWHPVWLWLWLLLAFLPVQIVTWGLLGAFMAERRGLDKWWGFKTGAWWGALCPVVMALRKPPSDVGYDTAVWDAECPNCGAEQDVSFDATEFTCWRCQQRTKLEEVQ
jgi:hypothetical protein